MNDFDEIEDLRQEVRCLNRLIVALSDENADLRRRLAFLAQELEHGRAKIPAPAIRT